MTYEDLEVTMTAVAIVAEINKQMKEGNFSELQRVMAELGYNIQLRKPKKQKKDSKKELYG